MSDQFKIRILYVVLSTDIPNNKRYIMSLDKDSVKLPHLDCTKDNLEKLDLSIIEHLKKLIFVNELEMIPQLISVNDKFITDKEPDIFYVVYGFVLSFSPNLNNCTWKEFSYLQPNEYSNLIFKVIQNLV